jgi:hypothetical protein
MTKDKLEKLNLYLKKMKSKLEDGIPEKHKNRPEQYKAFLEREIKMFKNQIDTALLEMGTK